jgi:hypothetical protein
VCGCLVATLQEFPCVCPKFQRHVGREPEYKHVGTKKEQGWKTMKPVDCTRRYTRMPLFTLAFCRLVLTYFPKPFEMQISPIQAKSLDELSLPPFLVLATWQMTCQ